MLTEEWIYREDEDGYRLEPAEALASRGATPWKILARGRWAALTVKQHRTLSELGENGPTVVGEDARAAALIRLNLAEDAGGSLRLTDLGRELVRDCAHHCGPGQP